MLVKSPTKGIFYSKIKSFLITPRDSLQYNTPHTRSWTTTISFPTASASTPLMIRLIFVPYEPVKWYRVGSQWVKKIGGSVVVLSYMWLIYDWNHLMWFQMRLLCIWSRNWKSHLNCSMIRLQMRVQPWSGPLLLLIRKHFCHVRDACMHICNMHNILPLYIQCWI
jgi:hypothetical protein